LRGTPEYHREHRKAQIVRDILATFTDDHLRAVGTDPDELRRMVEQAGLTDE